MWEEHNAARRMPAGRSIRELEHCLVVTIMGAVAAELQSLGHRPNFFYLQHAMGLASSMGLGIALCLPEQTVIVIDGDGSLLMNLGGLTHDGALSPAKLVHVVFDNESLLSVGGFPTATSTGTDLEGIARAAGIPQVWTVRECGRFQSSLCAMPLHGNELTTIIAKVEAKGPPATSPICRCWKIGFNSAATFSRSRSAEVLQQNRSTLSSKACG